MILDQEAGRRVRDAVVGAAEMPAAVRVQLLGQGHPSELSGVVRGGAEEGWARGEGPQLRLLPPR